ncbi:DUF6773 family protein [Paenibacillus aquistagni]|uniref:DUF6773 family protein n=1 Tax=Paenibacillus aquistagni TaxID=1852522 RepID=UPI00145B2ACB|nr:DUF6773 family protein [Paenibacillus aquistagni]NMM53095.1 hypothetical protein [Paenibacillus aquistagni]
MKWFKRKAVQDERIVNMKNQIAKEAWVLVMIICSISVIVKSFFFAEGQPVYTELIILIVNGIYYSIRSVRTGVYADEVEVHDQTHRFSMTKKQMMIGLASGLFLALFFGFRSAYQYGDGSGTLEVEYFFVVFLASLMMYIPFFVIVTAVSHLAMNNLSKRRSNSDLEDSDLIE